MAGVWFEKAKAKLLPVNHFLLTFTLPGVLRHMARRHQRLFYDLLFKAAQQALQQLAFDTRFCGGRLGMLGILHTWGRNLACHPHVHFIVSGGGLFEDERTWLPSKDDFLVPVKALSVLFRAKFRDLLKQKDEAVYNTVIKSCPGVWRKKWVVHSLPVGKGTAALKYLAAYVFKPAICNKNILSLTGDTVTFKYRDHRTKQEKSCSVNALDFITRYLQHVLPKGFIKVRYMGLYANACKDKLSDLKKLFSGAEQPPESTENRQYIIFPGDSTHKEKGDNMKLTKLPCCPRCRSTLTFVKNNARIHYYSHAPPKEISMLKSVAFFHT